MSELTFEVVSLRDLVDDGVIMAANEAFFWPLGLALAYYRDDQMGGLHTSLHIREYRVDGGWNGESISSEVDDLYGERKEAFMKFAVERIARLPEEERKKATSVVARVFGE